MKVAVHLHSILRDHLPPEARRRGTVTLPEGSTVADLLDHLGIRRAVVVSVNGAQAGDLAQVLQDGDEVEVFTAVAGGYDPFTEEWDEMEWLRAAARNPAFDFLSDPEEDIYSLTDGKPVHWGMAEQLRRSIKEKVYHATRIPRKNPAR